MLEEALEHLVRGIVDTPDDVQVDLRTLRRGRVLEVRVHPDDLGKVIGRGGHTGRMLVNFEEVADRTAAEGLRNTLLVVDSASSPAPDDDDEFWDHQLVGIHAMTTSGDELGVVTDVLHPPGPDLLAVRTPDGR